MYLMGCISWPVWEMVAPQVSYLLPGLLRDSAVGYLKKALDLPLLWLKMCKA